MYQYSEIPNYAEVLLFQLIVVSVVAYAYLKTEGTGRTNQRNIKGIGPSPHFSLFHKTDLKSLRDLFLEIKLFPFFFDLRCAFSCNTVLNLHHNIFMLSRL